MFFLFVIICVFTLRRPPSVFLEVNPTNGKGQFQKKKKKNEEHSCGGRGNPNVYGVASEKERKEQNWPLFVSALSIMQ